ncbi:hypothetical protein [Amycolatopsis sp. CA-128772]|uniref:hypothetical protein n=1 Tax=Amycolatopsis sp. CA-128772 TaxID=2073159 RepID=UPI001304B157|nr:hypothetical protein [Amycolatopsis sp. CA-128772]
MWATIRATEVSSDEELVMICSSGMPSRPLVAYQPRMSSGVNSLACGRVVWRRTVSANGTSK